MRVCKGLFAVLLLLISVGTVPVVAQNNNETIVARVADVEFPDAHLEAYLRTQFFSTYPETEPITVEMMEQVTSIDTGFCEYDADWNCDYQQITDLTGLEYAVNLQYVHIYVDIATGMVPAHLEILNDLPLIYLALGLTQDSDYSIPDANIYDESALDPVKTAFRSIIEQIDYVGEIDLLYNFSSVDYEWLEGLHVEGKFTTLRTYFQEMPFTDSIDYEVIGVNEANEKLYAFEYKNPVHPVTINDNTKTIIHDEKFATVTASVQGVRFDETRLTYFDTEGNEIFPGLYGGIEKFATARFVLTETELATMNTGDMLLTLSINQETSNLLTRANGQVLRFHNMIMLVIGEERLADTYTVAFESNGGTIVDAITDIEAGATISEPTPPTKDGFTFSGWHMESALTNLWDFPTATVNEDKILYAKWLADDVIITETSDNNSSENNTTLPVTGLPTNMYFTIGIGLIISAVALYMIKKK